MASEKTSPESLESQGWKRQFAADEPRLSETVQLYREIGFQVRLEPLHPREKTSDGQVCQTNGECRTCFEGFEDRYKIIFTKPGKKDLNPLEEDLF